MRGRARSLCNGRAVLVWQTKRLAPHATAVARAVARFCGVPFELSLDHASSAPTVFIVPTDHDIAGADVAPPGLELFTRDIKRCRRHQMIEHYRVLFAPAEI